MLKDVRKWINDLRLDPDTNEFSFHQQTQAIAESAREMVNTFLADRMSHSKGKTSSALPVEHLMRRTLESKAWREMYGEVVDPVDKLMFTTEAQSRVLAALTMLKSIGSDENEGVVYSAYILFRFLLRSTGFMRTGQKESWRRSLKRAVPDSGVGVAAITASRDAGLVAQRYRRSIVGGEGIMLTKNIQVRVPMDIYKVLNNVAKERLISRSDVVREAILQYLKLLSPRNSWIGS